MRIIPAIDIIDGKCVRLTQGDYGKMKVYREDPLEVAKEFEDANLEYLHLVDLDGAKKGKVVNWEVIEAIQEKTTLKVDFGGGVKSKKEVEELLDLGIHQINIGSLAVKQPDEFTRWLKKYGPENFILSADVMLRLTDLAKQFEKAGLEYIACTDIRTDGTLKGPNVNLYRKLKKQFPKLKIIAGGGISSMDDLRELKYLKIDGAIIGKAIYENKITLSELRNF